MLTIIKKLLLHSRKTYLNYSFSQEGEDLILDRLLNNVERGFYVDVGAHHPFRFSNTQLFYERGWNGINIEPNPDNFKYFKKYRKNDINLNIGLSNIKGSLKYYMFNEPALNTFDRQEALLKEKGIYRIDKTVDVEVTTLSTVLELYLPKSKSIDFLSIDVEGFEKLILKSYNFDICRPKVIVVEILRTPLNEISNNEIYKILEKKNYYLHSKLYNSHIFTAVEF